MTQIGILQRWKLYQVDRSLESFAEWLRAHPSPDEKPSGSANASELLWLATPTPDARPQGHPRFSKKHGFDIAHTDGLFFDIDGLAAAEAAFTASLAAIEGAGLGYVYTPSHSRNDAEPFRGHVQLLFSTPCPAHEHHRAWKALHTFAFPKVDPRQRSPVRGRNAPQSGAPIIVRPGALVDWQEWAPKAPPVAAHEPEPTSEAETQRDADDERVARLIASVWGRGTTGDRAFGALGGWLARLGVSRARAIRIAQGVGFLAESVHPDIERRIDQAYDGEHGMGWTALVKALSLDSTGEVAAGPGRLAMGGAEGAVRDALSAANAVLSASVTPSSVLQSAPADTPPAPLEPRQDTSGLQLAPGGWPWVLRKGNWCWLHHADRQGYWGPIEKADIRLQIRRTHGHLVGLRGPRGGDIQEHDFEQIYVQRVDSLRATYIARESTWDPAKLELTLRQLRWADFPATFHADIDTWLRSLAGDSYPILAQWLASCVALNRPAPALYLHGDANVGKTLLAVGLARLWTCEQPAPFKESLADFNEAAATCPLVFADEGFPDGMSFAEFREMVTAPSRRVNEKYKAKYPVLGYVRIILAANNANALRYQRTGALTAADIRAVADRLLVISARAEAQALLAAFDRQSMAEKRIAEHVLWLASTVALESAESRMCAKPGGAMALLDALQTARYAEPMRTLSTLVKSDAKVAAGSGVYPRDGRVLVNTPALFKACLKPFQFQHNAPKEQDVRDFVNAFRTGPAEWVWADGRSVKVNPVDWTRIAAQLEQLE